MVTDPSSPKNAKISPADELARRWALASEPEPFAVSRPRAALLLNELTWVTEPVKRRLNPLKVRPAAKPKTVLMLPGFGAHPLRMRNLARELERAGHVTKNWGAGWNLGATSSRFSKIERRLVEVYDQAGEPLVLLGWSLGGVMARELAKLHPDKVRKVITMGSPFSGSPRANNGWRAYQAIVGHRVDEPEVDATPALKPPVETIALWSPMDGVVHPRSAKGRPGERDRAISVRCTHMGFVEAREAIAVVLRELDR